MKKTHKVVMLPTEKAENCIAMYHNGKISWTNQLLTKSYRDSANIKVFQLHIISDDEIKEGDWCLCIGADLDQAHPYHNAKIIQYTGKELGIGKIVATTDESIKCICIKCNARYGEGNHNCEYPSDHNGNLVFPQLPESFVQAYIKAYNEGKPIAEVDLEMEENTKFKKPLASVYNSTRAILNNLDTTYTIKTRPDNTVILHQSKTYSREEVEKLIRKAVFRSPSEPVLNVLNFDKWIQDNL